VRGVATRGPVRFKVSGEVLQSAVRKIKKKVPRSAIGGSVPLVVHVMNRAGELELSTGLH
jgi:hypothetical protein